MAFAEVAVVIELIIKAFRVWVTLTNN